MASTEPDVVVVPTLGFMVFHVHRSLYFSWSPYTSNKYPGSSGELTDIELHRAYWNEVRSKHYRPGRRRLIVMHYSFVFDIEGHTVSLKALSEQPAAFVEMVVIPTIESNLQNTEMNLFTAQQAGWTDDAESEIALRRNAVASNRTRSGPLLITMPYPVGITQHMHLGYATRQTSATLPRKIAVLFAGSLDKSPAQVIAAEGSVAPLAGSFAPLHRSMRSMVAGAEEFKCTRSHFCIVCEDFADACGAKDVLQWSWKKHDKTKQGMQLPYPEPWGRGMDTTPGWFKDSTAATRTHLMGNQWRHASFRHSSFEMNKKLLDMFQIALASKFCLEPAGDTLTRSHFYVALLCGCIPVIIDGEGTENYRATARTSWPWRSLYPEAGPHAVGGSSGSPWIDYNSFAVVLNFTTVQANGLASEIEALVHMETRQPARYAALRRGVDRVAKTMHYGMDMCTGVDCDAFATLQGILERESTVRQNGRTDKELKKLTQPFPVEPAI